MAGGLCGWSPPPTAVCGLDFATAVRLFFRVNPLPTIYQVCKHEEDLPAQGSPPQAPAWIPSPDANPRWPGRDSIPAPQGPQASGRLK